jgi:hypothetical protein
MLQGFAAKRKVGGGPDLACLSSDATTHVKRCGDDTPELGRPLEPWLSQPVFREALREPHPHDGARPHDMPRWTVIEYFVIRV